MNYFDLGFLLLIVIFVAIGIWRGFIKSLASLIGWFVAFVLAIVLARVVASWMTSWGFIRNLYFRDGEGFSFYSKIYNAMPEELKQINRDQIVNEALIAQNPTDAIIKIISKHSFILGFLASLFKGSLIEPLADPVILGYNFDNLAQGFSLLISGSILVVFTGIAIFLLLRIGTFIMQFLVKGIKFPALLDRPLGGLIGFARAIGYSIVLLMAFGFMLNFSFMQTVRTELYGDADHRPAVILPLAEWTFDITDSLMKYSDTTKIFEASDFVNTQDEKE